MTLVEEETVEQKGIRRWWPSWQLGNLRGPLAGNLAFLFSVGIILVFTFFAIFPQAVALHDPTVNQLSLRHRPPGFVDAEGEFYFLGTDHLGRSVWSRIVWGARYSLIVGYLGLLIGGTVGTSVGLVAGYRGGWIDRILVQVIDIYLSMPYILIAIVWALLVGTDIRNLILIVAVRGWVEFARVVRGQALLIREQEYVTAAMSVGVTESKILLRYILPNTLAPILVVAGYQLGRLIILEATLSFLTIGIRPPTPAWGSMLNDARSYMSQAWWTVLFPGLAISLVVMSANFAGDSLRDYLDPTLRTRA
ncbi:MAG: ABC transporter permease [Chloroflexota bacterium]|nr:ABC transporter permease [Chloroflexota bacterium]